MRPIFRIMPVLLAAVLLAGTGCASKSAKSEGAKQGAKGGAVGGAVGGFICQVSPEAATGGTLAVIQDKDIIEIDIMNGILDVNIADEE